MRVVVINHLTLDGVMQGPARPEEDTRGGFSRGGWAVAGSDDTTIAAVGERMGKASGGLLLGRRSYEDMLGVWNERGDPFKDALNNAPKYVASTSSSTSLQWPNSTLLHGDIPSAVTRLKEDAGGNLVIMGSGQLIRSLLPHGLIDEFLLLIHPVVLGTGQRLFETDDEVVRLRLDSSRATTAGVLILGYSPV